MSRVPDPLVRRAAQLLLHRYMLERGYKQDAHYIGNGHRFRNFRRLAQYAPERLPAVVLNKLCARDGRMRNKGSKGCALQVPRQGALRPQAPPAAHRETLYFTLQL